MDKFNLFQNLIEITKNLRIRLKSGYQIISQTNVEEPNIYNGRWLSKFLEPAWPEINYHLNVVTVTLIFVL